MPMRKVSSTQIMFLRVATFRVSVGHRILMTEALLVEFVALGEKLAEGMISSCPAAAPHPAPQTASPMIAEARSPAQLRVLSRYSHHAITLARSFAECSSHGRQNDPAFSAEKVRERVNVPDDEIAEAVDELERDGLVYRRQSLGMGKIGIHELVPKPGFFQVFDPAFGIGDPVADARLVAAALIEGGEHAGSCGSHRQAWMECPAHEPRTHGSHLA
ncbi:hypothetical protein IBL26_22545 [Roseomonas aerophila]|uniref:Uncharacterized protein n=1 Tax=Teichococcus aerophilus TaxID=1224513 RepID=A0ABR7RU82_9PROT|nr:hypothetical protein [Pseudoroseomonas aerophila]MBC9209637.1 hypothetical protein [Pseudoroseomonas aerophila]